MYFFLYKKVRIYWIFREKQSGKTWSMNGNGKIRYSLPEKGESIILYLDFRRQEVTKNDWCNQRYDDW